MGPYCISYSGASTNNHNIRNDNLWSIKYNVYADQHRQLTVKTTDSNCVYCDCRCRGATVGDRGSMPWMPAYIAVPNLGT
jgi:hypothetical protein